MDSILVDSKQFTSTKKGRNNEFIRYVYIVSPFETRKRPNVKPLEYDFNPSGQYYNNVNATYTLAPNPHQYL